MDEIKDVIAGLIQNYEVIRDSEVLLSKEANAIGKCPLCGSAVEEKAKGYFCSNRGCKFALWKNSRYFESRIGFVKLQGFMKPENYLKYAEMAMEDDYGMLDGIINNGKAPATDERPSVLGQLKEMSVFDAPHKPSRSHPERDIE